MKQVYNQKAIYAFCKSSISAGIKDIYCLHNEIYAHMGVSLFEIEDDKSVLVSKYQQCHDSSIERHLDMFYFILDKSDTKQLLLDVFFKWLAPKYEIYIDVERNKCNIFQLMAFMQELIGPLNGKCIIDYGCGTGLSHDAANDYNVDLLGVERCPTMRMLATERGMLVRSHAELERINDCSVSGVISSYVMHYPLDEIALTRVWSKIKIGGAFVANFHKAYNAAITSKFFCSIGASAVNLNENDQNNIHGVYVAYVKHYT